jgi:phosphoglycerate dehydrogenase-like enzyme
MPPGTPEAMAEAVRRGGGEIVAPERANAILWYGSAHAAPDHVLAMRPLLSAAVRWVQLPWAGIEDTFELGLIDADRVWTAATGAYGVTVAEHVVALFLAAARRLPECARADTWRRSELEGVPLAGCTVGIVGAGGIGRETIRMLEPFGVRTIALTRSGRDVPGADRSLGPDGLEELLAASDYVVVCAPLTAETRGLIGPRELALIGPRGVLVNVGRGPVVDTDAVVAALRSGRLGRAHLDVTDPEPLPDGHPLWSEPHALITPHVANTRARLDAELERRIEENVRRFGAGDPLLGVIDVAAGY